MSVNSTQQRYPWLMAPLDWFTVAITPERWAGIFDRAATSVTRFIVRDSTGLARFLRDINPFSRVRESLLPHSGVLRWLDWKVRKGFWTLFWCGIVVLQNWPRRAAIPRSEKPIRLLSAPETYADFQAPTLVVPDDVPYAEKGLGIGLGTQFVHLVQDVYPIVKTHQPEADRDPQTRFDDAYTFLYRIARTPPRWHPDLADAARAGNLLGALGSGGPFAKLLERVSPATDDYVIDLRHMQAYPVREGLCHLGSRIHYQARHRSLVVTGVQYEDRMIAPGSPDWDRAERIALAGLLTHLTVWRQGMEYHVGGLAPVPVVTHNYLPAWHPLRRLLAAHLTRHLTTSVHTHVTLRRTGFDVSGFTFPYDVILRYYDDGAAAFDIRRLDVEHDARARGMSDSLDYPYLAHALRYHRIIERYVAAYVDAYFPGDEALGADPHVRIWFEALDAHIVRGIRAYVPELTRANLVKLCTLLIYSLSVGHTENSLWHYAVFMPTTVRLDGAQQSVGQVQDIVNFQLLIATPTSLLLSDISHLALDGRGAEIMRRFTRDLQELQRDMEAEPSRYWQLFPREVEASVSC
jgi:hypothetical protein